MPAYNYTDFVIRDDLYVLSGSVIYGAMASGQVQSGMIGDYGVLNNNIASGSIDITKLASGLYFELTSGKITSGYIGNSSVTQETLAQEVLVNFI